MIHFEKITEDNFKAIVEMKRPDGERFVASNAYSLAQAWLYRESGDVYPFAIYSEGEPVGFMMLDEDLEERCLVIWFPWSTRTGATAPRPSGKSSGWRGSRGSMIS